MRLFFELPSWESEADRVRRRACAAAGGLVGVVLAVSLWLNTGRPDYRLIPGPDWLVIVPNTLLAAFGFAALGQGLCRLGEYLARKVGPPAIAEGLRWLLPMIGIGALAGFAIPVMVREVHYEDLVAEARAKEKSNDHVQAVALASQAIGLKPGEQEAYLLRGQASINKRDYDQAVGDLSTAIRIGPVSGVALRWRGLAHQGRGQFKEALEDASEAIRLNSDDAEAHCQRGDALASLGRRQEAIAAYCTAIRLDPAATERVFRGLVVEGGRIVLANTLLNEPDGDLWWHEALEGVMPVLRPALQTRVKAGLAEISRIEWGKGRVKAYQTLLLQLLKEADKI